MIFIAFLCLFCTNFGQIFNMDLKNCLPKQYSLPTIVTTWSAPCFQNGTETAWKSYQSIRNRIKAVVDGCSYCEEVQCDGTIGYGGSPDELGRTTLDALVMDGPGHKVGAVAQLSKVKEAAKVAWAVLKHTEHTMLAGEYADKFALDMGFNESNLQTNKSLETWKNWKRNNCQPNFWQNVRPDPSKKCGPYKPLNFNKFSKQMMKNNLQKLEQDHQKVGQGHQHHSPSEHFHHDTVGMVIVDENGDLSAATSTNGATHKIPGRVSDSCLTGAGAYVDNDVGAAAATGDGDVMQRFLPSFRTVENMRHGMTPDQAASESCQQIAKFYPEFRGAVIALTKDGRYGAGCHGIGSFTYCVRNNLVDKVQLVTVKCVDNL